MRPYRIIGVLVGANGVRLGWHVPIPGKKAHAMRPYRLFGDLVGANGVRPGWHVPIPGK